MPDPQQQLDGSSPVMDRLLRSAPIVLLVTKVIEGTASPAELLYASPNLAALLGSSPPGLEAVFGPVKDHIHPDEVRCSTWPR